MSISASKSMTPERRKALSDVRMGDKNPGWDKPVPKIIRQKISKSNKGKPFIGFSENVIKQKKQKMKGNNFNDPALQTPNYIKDQIITDYDSEKYTKKQLGKKFGLKPTTISNILMTHKIGKGTLIITNEHLNIIEEINNMIQKNIDASILFPKIKQFYNENDFTIEWLANCLSLKVYNLSSILNNKIKSFKKYISKELEDGVIELWKINNHSYKEAMYKYNIDKQKVNFIISKHKKSLNKKQKEDKKFYFSENQKIIIEEIIKSYKYPIPDDIKLKIYNLYNETKDNLPKYKLAKIISVDRKAIWRIINHYEKSLLIPQE